MFRNSKTFIKIDVLGARLGARLLARLLGRRKFAFFGVEKLRNAETLIKNRLKTDPAPIRHPPGTHPAPIRHPLEVQGAKKLEICK